MRRCLIAAAALVLVASAGEAATCESLSALPLANTTVTTAQTVAAGTFTQPGRGGRGGGNAFASLPAFCRVAVTLRPTPRSDIKAEVWLPSVGWNGKLQVVGNGAWAGSISYAAMATALAAGYVAASTDTGHTGGAQNATVNREVLTDFAHRAIHETTATAKGDRRLLWRGAEAVVFQRVLHRRASGADGGAAVSE